MTVMLRKPAREGLVWSTMPGWGIVADLTPPELVAARSLKTLRRVIAGIVALVVVLCGAGVFLAHRSDTSAQDGLTAAQNRTTALTAKQGSYAKVTQIEAAIAAAKNQQTTLMSTDVDMAKLVLAIAQATPNSVDPSSLNVSLSGASTDASGSTTPVGTTQPTIGTVTMTGTATKIDDLAAFVAALTATKGFTNVVPTTNARTTGRSTSWTLTFSVTSARYSKRFAATPATSGTQTTGGSR